MPKGIRGRLPCSIAGCGNQSRSRGWCAKHYERWRAHGDPTKLMLRERTGTRTCARCGCSPDQMPFRMDKRAPDGLGAYCKACEREYNREHYLRHRAARIEDNHERYERNKARYLAAQRDYRLANLDRERERSRERSRGNPLGIERARRWRAENPDRARAIVRAWFDANPERVRALAAKRRMRLRGSTGKVEAIDRLSIWERDGGLCGLCAEPVLFASMHLDHIKPLSKGGDHTAANTQPSHPRCNSRKKDREVPRWAFATGSALQRLAARSSGSPSSFPLSGTTTTCSTSQFPI